MTDPTTTNIGLAAPLHGSHVDDWDIPVNSNSGILDTCFGNVTAKSLSNVGVTLSTPESQVSILRFSGALTGNVVITLGAIVKTWTIENNTTGAFFIQVQGTAGTGNKVGLPPGSSQIYWDGTNCSFVNLDRVGAYWDYAGAAVPAWIGACTVPPYLLCDGTTYSAITYPQLNQILGTTTLPDLRGRVRVPLDGGTGRVTTAGSGVDGTTRFAAGGGQNQTIAQANIPNYALPVTDPGHVHNVNTDTSGRTILATNMEGGGGGSLNFTPNFSQGGANPLRAATSTTGISVASGGSGTPLTVMQPSQVSGITMIRAA